MLCIFWGVLTEEQKNLVEHIFHTHHVKFINISDKSNDYLKKSPVYGHFRKTAA